MKQLYTIGLLAILSACGSQQQHGKQMANVSQASTTAQQSPAETTAPEQSKADTAQVSTVQEAVDNGNNDKLKQLADKKVFSTIHGKLIATVPASLQEYCTNSPDYNILSFSKGNLFGNDKEDLAFVIYDKKKVKISILVFDAMANKYLELYKDIKVENELKSMDCNSAGDALDRGIEDEIIYQGEYLIKDPGTYLQSPPCKIADISKDKDIILKDGCLSKRSTKADQKNALCIATSSVYNNWACLRHDKTKNIFVIFYSQAFAD